MDEAAHQARMKQMLEEFWLRQGREMDDLEIGSEQVLLKCMTASQMFTLKQGHELPVSGQVSRLCLNVMITVARISSLLFFISSSS